MQLLEVQDAALPEGQELGAAPVSAEGVVNARHPMVPIERF